MKIFQVKETWLQKQTKAAKLQNWLPEILGWEYVPDGGLHGTVELP